MADSVKPQASLHLLCSYCGKENVFQSRPNFCPECGEKISDKDIKPFSLATEPSQSGDSGGGEYQGATNDQVPDVSCDELSSDISQLSSGGNGSISKVGQIVDTVAHPLGTDDQSSSSQPSSSQAHDQRHQGVQDQSYQGPQDACSQVDQDNHQDTHGHDTHEDVYEKDSGTHNQSSNTCGQDSQSCSGQDQSGSLVSWVVC